MKKSQKSVTYGAHFSKAAWIIRIITMTIALISIVYYLRLYNKGELAFQKGNANIEKDSSVIRMKIPVGRAKDN